jgi:deoxyribodipyrimidine photo-lyase
VGERWMARLLRDHDVVSNAMGWQWGHSAAPSAQPYFRVMSPWAQSKRFDADAEYIKRWVPELAAVAARDIHRWGEAKIREKSGEAGTGAGYPAPMFDWKTAATEAIAAYRAANAAV